MKSNTLKTSQFFTTRTLTSLSFLTAVSIILARILGLVIPLAGFPALKINFSNIPVIISGILYGPFAGFMSGAVSDGIGYLINPQGGAYFPGFTLSKALVGFIPGLVYKLIKNKKISKINFNIINAGFIILTSIALIYAFNAKGILVFDNGVYFDGTVIPNFIIGIFVILITIYMFLPTYISRNFKTTSKLFSFDKIYFIVSFTQIITSLILNTYFLSILFNKGVLVFIPARIVTNYIMIPMFSIIIIILLKALKLEKNKDFA